MSNETYRQKNLALIQKIPTPITPIEMNKEHTQITLAYFDKKSTVDYIGAVQGVPVCFDAKECNVDSFPLANIHEHQIEFMRDFEKQGGLSFIIIMYMKKNEAYYVPFSDILKFWNRKEEGGRKSFTFEEIDKNYKIRSHGGIILHYLEMIAKDLETRT